MFFSLFALVTLDAQRNTQSYNFDNKYKSKDYYFGIRLGFSSNNYRILQSEEFILNQNFTKIESISGPSFDIGLIANLKIGQDFDFRFNPGFAFASKDVEFKLLNPPEPNQQFLIEKIQSNYLEFPFILRYKSAPYKDLRIYILGGFKYVYDLEAKNRLDDSKSNLLISPHDYLAEIGVGFQFFFPYFILSPELKYSHGLDNINIYDRSSPSSQVIEKILSRNFTLTLHFEG